MKKVISLCLAVCLVLSMTAISFAADPSDASGSTKVSVVVNDGENEVPGYEDPDGTKDDPSDDNMLYLMKIPANKVIKYKNITVQNLGDVKVIKKADSIATKKIQTVVTYTGQLKMNPTDTNGIDYKLIKANNEVTTGDIIASFEQVNEAVTLGVQVKNWPENLPAGTYSDDVTFSFSLVD